MKTKKKAKATALAPVCILLKSSVSVRQSNALHSSEIHVPADDLRAIAGNGTDLTANSVAGSSSASFACGSGDLYLNLPCSGEQYWCRRWMWTCSWRSEGDRRELWSGWRRCCSLADD